MASLGRCGEAVETKEGLDTGFDLLRDDEALGAQQRWNVTVLWVRKGMKLRGEEFRSRCYICVAVDVVV